MEDIRFFDSAVPAELAQWTALWQLWPGREVFAHPHYVRLFARPVDRVMCAATSSRTAGVLFPFLLRPLAAEPWAETGETAWDLTTPYGYGGAFAWNCGEAERQAFWSGLRAWAAGHGVVSAFARLALFADRQLPFDGETITDRMNVVCRLDRTPDELWRGFEHKVRKNVNCAKRSGLKVETDAAGRRLDEFLAVYYATMKRREAADGYFFPREFFERLIRGLPGQFVFLHVLDAAGRVVSTELALVSAEHLYSFLGGTLAESFAQRPNDLLKHEAILWGCQSGKQAFVLGGGYDGDDGIFRYKKSFAPEGIVPFRVARQIYDPAMYDRLMERRRRWEAGRAGAWSPQAGFFPAYRAPQSERAPQRVASTPEAAMDRIYLSPPHMSDDERALLVGRLRLELDRAAGAAR